MLCGVILTGAERKLPLCSNCSTLKLSCALNYEQWKRAASECSPPITFLHPIDRPPSPVNVTVTQLKANSATVSWDVPEGDVIIGYAISQQVSSR